MPELPEVETTVRSLNRAVKGLRIVDVWSDYDSAFHKGNKNIKDRENILIILKSKSSAKKS